MPETQLHQPPLALQRDAPLFEQFPESDTYSGVGYWREFGVVPDKPKPERAPAKIRFSPTLFGDVATNTDLFFEGGELVRKPIEAVGQLDPETAEKNIERALTGSALGILHELLIILIRERIRLSGPRGLYGSDGEPSPIPIRLTYPIISRYYPTAGAYLVLTTTDSVNRYADSKNIFEQALAAWCDIRSCYHTEDPRAPVGEWRPSQWFSGEYVTSIWNSKQITDAGIELIESWKGVLASSRPLPRYLQPIHDVYFQVETEVPVAQNDTAPFTLLYAAPDCIARNTAFRGRPAPTSLRESDFLVNGFSVIDHKLDLGREISPVNHRRNLDEAALIQLAACVLTTIGSNGNRQRRSTILEPRDVPIKTVPVTLMRYDTNGSDGVVRIHPIDETTGELLTSPNTGEVQCLDPHPVSVYLQGLERPPSGYDFRMYPLISTSTGNGPSVRMWDILRILRENTEGIRAFRTRRNRERTWCHPKLVPQGGWKNWQYRLNTRTGELSGFK